MGTDVRQSGGKFRNARRGPEMMSEGGNVHEVTGEFWGQDPNGGDCMGKNGAHPKREGGVLGYRTR